MKKLTLILASMFLFGVISTVFLYTAPPPKSEDTENRCSDGKDNDQDGLIDCDDPDCEPFCGGGGGIDLDYQLFFVTDSDTIEPEGNISSIEQSALDVINGATSELRLCIYGFNRDSIRDALIDRHNAGVTVLVATEKEQIENPRYAGHFQALVNAGITVVDDNDAFGDSGSGTMHNKFIIADSTKVWTGSTNFTDTGFWYNRNHAIVLNHAEIANEYKIIHTAFMAGSFHQDSGFSLKTFNFNDATVKLSFSPFKSSNLSITETLLKDTIDAVNSSIEVMIFYWNRSQITDRVLARKDAGVSVEVLFDAVGASYANGTVSQDGALCAAGVNTWIEDFGGKMHHKAAIFDSATVVLGSANWTSSGFSYNDENMLIITHGGIAAAMQSEFSALKSTLDNRLICCEHSAETNPISTGNNIVGNACADNSDNDYDDLVDGDDPDCAIDLAIYCDAPPPDCGETGTVCSTGSDCCSGTCYNGRTRTCK